MMERGGMFAKEVQIYAELFSKWPQTGDHLDPLFKWRPECFFTRSDVMVLEEISKDYRHIEYKGNFEMRHCQEMMKALAKMHASSLNFERETGERLSDSYGHLMFEVALQDGNTWFLAGLELVHFVATHYEEHFRDILVPEKQIFMQKLHQVFKYRDEGNDFEKVLCHRDLWHSNMFFKYSEENNEHIPKHCVMIDYQICSYHSPIFDLMISMFVSTRREFRDKELNNCFGFYFEYLVNTLKESFRFTEEEVEQLNFLKPGECEKIREYYYFYAMVLNCIFTPLTQLKPGTLTKMKRDDPQRYFTICNINRNEFTRDNMDRDPFYKEYMIEAVRELVEFVCKMK